MILNVKASFVYGWFSFRNISIYADNILCGSITGTGKNVIEIPHNTKVIKFELGKIYPYTTTVYLKPEDYDLNEVFVGLSLNHRGIALALYDSLKTNYLKSTKLSEQDYMLFGKNVDDEQLIELKNYKTSILMLLISLLILVFSVVQQNNDLSPFAFLIGLSSLVTSLVYFRERKVVKSNYMVRIIASVLLFILAVCFLENSYMYLNWIILLFTALLVMFFIENLKDNNKTNIKEA
ncbi:hypothetical protein SAMN05421741_1134 [Paenimyroides ummariense]|uniref:Uncharacterized protein n=1 Tax=Paenimyroides ummariense TaxID=913024 RepID=A0A1I5CP41_9FLAO|nr:hypothetical protein [Paenimyroides ummariense]SFN88646.1 hypothetical protein SAMN05421741_1134 [Paenimyroides ummariense]